MKHSQVPSSLSNDDVSAIDDVDAGCVVLRLSDSEHAKTPPAFVNVGECFSINVMPCPDVEYESSSTAVVDFSIHMVRLSSPRAYDTPPIVSAVFSQCTYRAPFLSPLLGVLCGGTIQVDASQYKPGQLRVRVIMADSGTTAQLRRATAEYLSTIHIRNPVSP